MQGGPTRGWAWVSSRLTLVYEALVPAGPAPIRWARWCRDKFSGCAPWKVNVERAMIDHGATPEPPVPSRVTGAPHPRNPPSRTTRYTTTTSAPNDDTEQESEKYLAYLLNLNVYPQPKQKAPWRGGGTGGARVSTSGASTTAVDAMDDGGAWRDDKEGAGSTASKGRW